MQAGPRPQRISHPALIGANLEETVKFYTEVLGMDLVLKQPNLDDPSMTHLFFNAGNDNFIAFFVPADPKKQFELRGSLGFGSLQHLAFDVEPEDFEKFQKRLREHGIRYSGPIERGYERSIYFRDPNGIILELLTWITPPPKGLPQATIIKEAQQIREAERAYNVEDSHVRKAIENLTKARRG